jgi:hypothetical protein
MSFAEVKLRPSAHGHEGAGSVPRWAYEVTLPNGWMVRAADAGALAQLLQVAGN